MGRIFRQKGRHKWMLKYYRNGHPIVESSGTEDKTAAKKLLRNRETDIDRGLPVTAKVGRLRFEEGAADLVNEYKVNCRRSLDVLETRLTKHLQPFFAGRRMSTITSADVRTYVTHRLATPIVTGKGDAETSRLVSNAEINRELTTLKRAFTLAVQGGKLLHQPHIPMLKENNVRTGFFEWDQFQAVCRNLPAPLQAVMRFAYVTGWRIDSEILPLEWRQVDFDERLTPSQKIPGTVRLDAGTTKNDEGRVFPFTEELRGVLEAQHAEHLRLKQAGKIAPWVFFRLVAKGRGGATYPKRITRFNKAWKTACLAAGAPGRIPHDLRRTAVRNLVRAGIPERVAMRLTGHKTRSVFERYNIVSDGDLGTAAERIDDASKNSATRSATLLGRTQSDSGGLRRKRSQ
jgi:integrase